MSTMAWMLSTFLRAVATLLLLVWVLDAPGWAGLLGAVVVCESADLRRAGWRR